jgi:hypothetical protein
MARNEIRLQARYFGFFPFGQPRDRSTLRAVAPALALVD